MAEANVTNNCKLSPEVLVKIFEHCGLNELLNIIDVCQLWRDVAIHQHMSVNDLVIRHSDDINDLISLLCKPVSFTKFHVVWDVPSNVDCSSVSLDALANATSLTHLQSFMFNVKDADNKEYQKVLEALLTLILQTSTRTLALLKLMNTQLDQTTCVKLVEVIGACEHLLHLVLNDCNLCNQRSYEDIIPTLTHVQLLDLRGAYLSDNLSFVAAVKRGCPDISNNIMIGLLRVRASDDMDMLPFLSHVVRLPINLLNSGQLRSLISCLNECVSRLSVDELELSWCKDYMTEDMLLSLVRRLRLKDLFALGCRHLTNEGVVNVITSSPELERISIMSIKSINTDIIPLLDRVVTEQNVRILAFDTKLSEQMKSNPQRELFTGKNGNICLQYRL